MGEADLIAQIYTSISIYISIPAQYTSSTYVVVSTQAGCEGMNQQTDISPINFQLIEIWMGPMESKYRE